MCSVLRLCRSTNQTLGRSRRGRCAERQARRGREGRSGKYLSARVRTCWCDSTFASKAAHLCSSSRPVGIAHLRPSLRIVRPPSSRKYDSFACPLVSCMAARSRSYHPLYGKIKVEKTKENKVLLHLTPILTLTLNAINEKEFIGKYLDYFWFDDEKIIFELSLNGKDVLALTIGNRKWIKEN